MKKLILVKQGGKESYEDVSVSIGGKTLEGIESIELPEIKKPKPHTLMSETPNLIIVGYSDEAILAGIETIRKWYGVHEPKDVLLIDDKRRIMEGETIDKLDTLIAEGTLSGYFEGVKTEFKKRLVDGMKPRYVEDYVPDTTAQSKRMRRGSNATPPSPSKVRNRKNKIIKQSRKQNRKH